MASMSNGNGKRSRLRRRILWGCGIAVVLVVALAVIARPKGGKEDEKDAVKTAKAETADIQVRVTEVGSVEPLVKVDVKSALSGKVVDLPVREGDVVRKGQVLARVEPDVNQARDLAQVKNAVNDAKIALEEARATHDRSRDLTVKGLLSKQDDLESETRFKRAQAVYDAAMDKSRIVEESGVPIALAQAGVTQRLNVTSPMDGVVIRRDIELGDTVTSGGSSFGGGTVLLTVADVGTMIVKAGINEVDIGKVRANQPVKVTLDAYPKVKFAGEIKRIAPAARLDDKVKVFDVEIEINRQGAELRTGMTANIDILGEQRAKVLTVPIEALFRNDEGELVYVKKPVDAQASATPGLLARAFAADKPSAKKTEKLSDKDRWKEKFEVRKVETGLASFEKVQIVEGLRLGDEVAVEDPTRPKDKEKKQ
jgi:HlyD family secretion protein